MQERRVIKIQKNYAVSIIIKLKTNLQHGPETVESIHKGGLVSCAQALGQITRYCARLFSSADFIL